MEDIQRREQCQGKVHAVQVNWYPYVIGNRTDMLYCISKFYILMLVCMHMSEFKCRIMTGNTSTQGELKRKGNVIEEQEHRGRC